MLMDTCGPQLDPTSDGITLYGLVGGLARHLPRAAQTGARLGSSARARLSAYSRTDASLAQAPRQAQRSGDAGSSRSPPARQPPAGFKS
jgi:hypothetical protein